ncbi:hypothetical protein HOLleu_43405 [Holothuria leucospilota]|uniref:Uncharacterized protein n=1 Tax=Holothuria leucospilota TaxID=206669 RepID=A0A9Q0YH02_HOLLE|nr:hypothetical protein HOLleu_43405 [Holothuria leucospilota]
MSLPSPVGYPGTRQEVTFGCPGTSSGLGSAKALLTTGIKKRKITCQYASLNEGKRSNAAGHSDENMMANVTNKDNAVEIGAGMNRGEGSQTASHSDESMMANDTRDEGAAVEIGAGVNGGKIPKHSPLQSHQDTLWSGQNSARIPQERVNETIDNCYLPQQTNVAIAEVLQPCFHQVYFLIQVDSVPVRALKEARSETTHVTSSAYWRHLTSAPPGM